MLLVDDEAGEVDVVTSRKRRALATVRIERLPIEGGLKPEASASTRRGSLAGD
jgi:hypothetical protein